MILTKEQLHDALVERHGADIQAKLDKACVGIAGLGRVRETASASSPLTGFLQD